MRDAPRLHVGDELREGAAPRLDEARTHYVLHVMRGGVGDRVRLFNASSGEWQARIAEAGRHALTLVVEELLRPPGPTEGPALIFAPLKRDATDLVVRMATELGATALHPVATERTVAGRVNLARLGLIAREAAEQCERLDLPVIAPPRPLDQVLGDWSPARPIAAAIERLDAPGPGRWAAASALLIGPEGGFTPRELDVLRAHPFVQPVSLGRLVLRADTAAAAGLALLRAAAPGQGG